MEKTFASVLRHSRLASFDKTIGQVYKTTKKNQTVGDWGLKRNLPTVIRTPHVTVKALDTGEHQTPWDSGENQVMFVKRWKENFPRSSLPARRSEEEEHHIATMTPAEFELFLKKVARRADEFQGLIEKQELTKDELFEFLKVNVTSERAAGGGVVGPLYSDNPVDLDYEVKGRILNVLRRTDGHAVGIGGVVAHMPRRYTLGMASGVDRRVTAFYVQQAEMDEEGKPRVIVSLRRKGAPTTVSVLHGDYYENGDPNVNLSAKEMWHKNSDNIRKTGQYNPMEENAKPNPEHSTLMARISDLLQKK
ncbi:hypothetical protein BY458DRAFT_520983 [Sporodiniella umbellata]|nr:hypothetical protein BY458DRAFT_520983 [Sporodiniella umbellata]